MLRIEYEAAAVPTFRVFGRDSVVRIVMFMVQQHFGKRDTVWIIGPPGTRMTEYEPEEVRLVERRPATEEDIRQIEARAEELLGHAALPMGTIQYGVVPDGFDQLKPTNAAPERLVTGQEYEVVVMAAGDFGSLEFIA